MRTKANGELVMGSDLVRHESVTERQVDEVLLWIDEMDAAYFLNVKRDPAKLEWVVIDIDGFHFIEVHPYKDFKRNLQVAEVCARALIEAGLMKSIWQQGEKHDI